MPDPETAKPDPKAQRNFTDPDSRIMRDGATQEFTQAYNAQLVVDGEVKGAGAPQGPAAQAMREKLASATGKARYKLRKAIVEPVIGQIKEVRGFRRLSFRGLQKVAAEWDFVCLSHNLLKLFRHKLATAPAR